MSFSLNEKRSHPNFLENNVLDRLREQERQEKEFALAELEQERQRYQALIELLREKGIDPQQL